MLSETKMRADGFHEKVDFDGYTAFYMERSLDSKAGGGLLTYVKSDLKAYCWIPEVQQRYKEVETERQWIILTIGNRKIACINWYLAAEVTNNTDFISWNEKMYEMVGAEIETLKSEQCNIIAVGDMNGHVGRNWGGALKNNHVKVNKNGQKIITFVEAHNLVCENVYEKKGRWTTWTGNRGARGKVTSCLDYCLTHGLLDITKEFNILDQNETGIDSDHYMIQLRLNITRTKKKNTKKKKILYSLGNKDNMDGYRKHATGNLKKIKLEEFEKLEQREMIEHIEESLINAAKHVYPPKKKKIKSPSKGLTQEVRKIIKEKKRLYEKLKSENGTEQDFRRYNVMKVKIKQKILKERGKRRRSLALGLYQQDPSMTKFWDLLKNNAQSTLKIEALRDKKGNLVYEEEQLKDAVYEAFKDRLKGEETQTEEINNPEYENDTYELEMMYPANFKEVALIIKSFKNNKAAGPRGLRFELLKHLSQEAIGYLVKWVNKVLTEARVDECLNIGHVKLLFKKGDNCDPTNYRPITGNNT